MYFHPMTSISVMHVKSFTYIGPCSIYVYTAVLYMFKTINSCKHTYSILKLREIFIKTYVLVIGNAAPFHFLHIFVPIWEYLHCNINHTRNDRTNMITYKLTFNLTQSR